MSPEGYRAPRRHYPTIRQDAYDGYLGPSGRYMRDGATRSEMNEAQRDYDEQIGIIDAAEDAGEILDGVLTIDWSRNYEGYQAKAYLSYRYIDTDGYQRRANYESRRTGGGGYDKASTAAASVLRQSPEFNRILMYLRENDAEEEPGYGVRLNKGEPYGPSFGGGVGMNALIGAMKSIGIDMYEAQYTDNHQVYTFQRIGPLPSESVRSAMGNAYKAGKGVAKKGVAKTRQVTSNVKTKAKTVGKTKAPAKKPASASSRSCASKPKTKAQTKKTTTKTGRR